MAKGLGDLQIAKRMAGRQQRKSLALAPPVTDPNTQRQVLAAERRHSGTAVELQNAGVASMSPSELLLFGAANGFVDLVDEALERGADLDGSRCSTGMTALHKAVAGNNYFLFAHLLDQGADPAIEDTRFRSAFYFACFGAAITAGAHRKFVAKILSRNRAHGRPLCAEMVLSGAYAANTDGVLAAILDEMDAKLLSKDSNGLCKVHFNGLDLLDNPLVRQRWPDGSFTEAGTTAVHILVSKNMGSLLIHPLCIGLMEWKWERYGKRLFQWELALSLAQIAAITLLCVLSCRASLVAEAEAAATNAGLAANGTDEFPEGLETPILQVAPSLNNYDLGCPTSVLRLVTELCVVVLGLLVLALALNDVGMTRVSRLLIRQVRKPHFKERKRNVLIAILAQLLVLAVAGMRAAGAEDNVQVVFLAVAAFLSWERFVHYMALRRASGPMVIVLVEFLIRDLLPFALVLVAIAVCFASSISLLVSSRYVEGEAEVNARPFATFPTAFSELLFGFRGSDAFSSVRTWQLRTQDADPLIVLFFLAYLVLGPILGMSLLVARFTSTFQTINQNSKAEWALRRFRYLSSREAFVEEPHFGFRYLCSKTTTPTKRDRSTADARKVAPQEEGPGGERETEAADAVEAAGGNAAASFVPCPDTIADGFKIEQYHSDLYEPYEAQAKGQEIVQVHELLVDVMIQMRSLQLAVVANQSSPVAPAPTTPGPGPGPAARATEATSTL